MALRIIDFDVLPRPRSFETITDSGYTTTPTLSGKLVTTGDGIPDYQYRLEWAPMSQAESRPLKALALALQFGAQAALIDPLDREKVYLVAAAPDWEPRWTLAGNGGSRIEDFVLELILVSEKYIRSKRDRRAFLPAATNPNEHIISSLFCGVHSGGRRDCVFHLKAKNGGVHYYRHFILMEPNGNHRTIYYGTGDGDKFTKGPRLQLGSPFFLFSTDRSNPLIDIFEDRAVKELYLLAIP